MWNNADRDDEQTVDQAKHDEQNEDAEPGNESEEDVEPEDYDPVAFCNELRSNNRLFLHYLVQMMRALASSVFCSSL